MIDKVCTDIDDAVHDIGDGATVMIGGFGDSGVPEDLIAALVRRGSRDLTIVANNAGSGEQGLAALLRENRVRRIICSYPRSSGSVWFEQRYRTGDVVLELVPQGTLSERIRAAGAGIEAIYTATGVGTDLADGKEVRNFDGKNFLLERALRADFALIAARAADRWGNLVYHRAARNYAPTMAMAADVTIVQVREVVPLGALDPEVIVTPGIFVQRVVRCAELAVA